MTHFRSGFRILMAAVAVSLALVGCGGASTGSGTTADATDLRFSSGFGYNGSLSTIGGADATTTISGGHLVTSFTQSGRTLRIEFPTATITSGASFTPGSADGTKVTYTEVVDRATQTLTWVGTGGSLNVSATSSGNTYTVEVSSVDFIVDTTVDGNAGTGTFLMNGTLGGVDVNGGGGVGGSVALTFSGEIDTNANTGTLNDGVAAFATVNGISNLTVTKGTGSSIRTLNFTLNSVARQGDNVNLSGLVNSQVIVTYTEGTGNAASVWVAKNGVLKIRTKTTTTAKVELVDATFENPKINNQNLATGTFVLNGTVSRL